MPAKIWRHYLLHRNFAATKQFINAKKQKKMTDKGIPFEEYNLEDYAEELDIMTAPVLQLDDGTLLTSPLQINTWINEQ